MGHDILYFGMHLLMDKILSALAAFTTAFAME